MRAAWLTDLHLDFVDRAQFEALAQQISAAGVDAVLISGPSRAGVDYGGAKIQQILKVR